MVMDNKYAAAESSIRVMIAGIGGVGCQTVNYVVEKGDQNLETLSVDTDIQSLLQSDAGNRLLIGKELTSGQGASGNVDIGRMAAEEAIEELEKAFSGFDVIFVTSGLGGGTGTGAIPVVVSVATKIGAVVICILASPFQFEGKTRNDASINSLKRIEKIANAVVVVSGNSLLRDNISSPNHGLGIFKERFYQSVLAVSELMTIPGLINIDMNDIRAIIPGYPLALIASGESSGEDRARKAAENALTDIFGNLQSLEGAQGVLFNVTGGADLSLYEVNVAAATIREYANPDVNMIFGAVIDPKLEDRVRVTILAGGMAAGADDELDAEIVNTMFGKKSTERSLKVFLCHSSDDKPIVRKLFQRLYSRKGIDPWLDEAKLLPGVRWDHEIAKAVKESHIVIVCVSKNSVSKEGYVQKEIQRALDIAQEKPEETIFIIPLKVEDCEIPDRLSQWQWVNYYEDGAFDRLLSSLQKRAQSLGIKVE